VYNGGGFVGCIAPSAYQHQGRYFQLADVMGVDKETGLSVMTASKKFKPVEKHFILDDAYETFDFGTEKSYVFAADEDVEVLKTDDGGLHIMLAAHRFGSGRAVYLAGLPYSHDNSRLLHRILFWAASKEDQLKKWFSTNIHTDCAAYPETGCFVVANKSSNSVKTNVFNGDGECFETALEPYQARWFKM